MAPPKKKSNKSPHPSTATIPSRKPPTPNWPPLTPLLPATDLSLHTILPTQILTIPNFWTPTLCKTFVSFLSSLPLVTTPGKPKKGDAVRVNDRFQVEDAAFAERLWSETALKELVRGDEEAQWNEERMKELWGGDVVCF